MQSGSDGTDPGVDGAGYARVVERSGRMHRRERAGWLVAVGRCLSRACILRSVVRSMFDLSRNLDPAEPEHCQCLHSASIKSPAMLRLDVASLAEAHSKEASQGGELLKRAVGPVGLEPTTNGLKVRCSTN